jgi:hypothetical protein
MQPASLLGAEVVSVDLTVSARRRSRPRTVERSSRRRGTRPNLFWSDPGSTNPSGLWLKQCTKGIERPSRSW